MASPFVRYCGFWKREGEEEKVRAMESSWQAKEPSTHSHVVCLHYSQGLTGSLVEEVILNAR